MSPLSADDGRARCSTSTPTRSPRRSARALGAEKLILCTGAPGILERVDDPRSLISYTDLAGLRRLREEGAIVDGMLPKAKRHRGRRSAAACGACTSSRTRRPTALLAEVFTNEGTGTLVVADTKALSPAEQGTGGRMTRLWDKGVAARPAGARVHRGRRPRARRSARGLRRARLDRARRDAARLRSC